MDTALSGISTINQLLGSKLHKHNLGFDTATHQAGDKVSIGILTPEKTQALLNREIADKLEKYFKDEGIELKGLEADDFTPEKVSERILGFVSGRILSQGDNDQQNEMMAQARKGIEQGFAEARDILESLNALNGQVKEDADSTYDLIQQGLDRLDKQINGGVVDDSTNNTNNDQDKQDLSVQQASVQNSFSRNENTKIEIITNDGDKILIDLFKQQSAQSSQRFSQNEDTSVYSQSRSISASAGISYQVQGELDEGEQKAIDDLLNDVAKVSDQFFSGNVQQAFKKALDMDFDSSELTHFALDLSYQESRSTAINTYRDLQNQSQNQSQNQNDKLPIEQAGLKEMSDFIKQMDYLFQHPFAMTNFLDSQEGMGDLLKGMNQVLHSDEMNKLEKDSSALLDSLVHQLQQRHSNNSIDNDLTDKEIQS